MAFTDAEKRDWAQTFLIKALSGKDYDEFRTFIQSLPQDIQDDLSDSIDDWITDLGDREDELTDLKQEIFEAP